jgi:ankyrin repeat protein
LRIHIENYHTDKNPKLINGEAKDIGWIPLHEAAQHGYLLICYMIMNQIEEKNPRDITGYTVLHAAASGGHLETFKLIMNKVTDINPGYIEGWTPLHAAVEQRWVAD